MTPGAVETVPKKELDRVLWFGVLAGPFAWALQQQVNYMITASACEAGERWWLHAVSFAALLLAAAGGFVSWRMFQRFGEGPIDQGEIRNTRARFMAVWGIAFSAFFTLVIVATEIPVWILGACA